MLLGMLVIMKELFKVRIFSTLLNTRKNFNRCMTTIEGDSFPPHWISQFLFYSNHQNIKQFLHFDPPVYMDIDFLTERDMDWVMNHITENAQYFERRKDHLSYLNAEIDSSVIETIKTKAAELSGIVIFVLCFNA